MALPENNLTISSIKAVLNSSSNNVKDLCVDPSISKWSKWKPVRFNKLTGLTQNDMIAVNSGIVLQSVVGVENVLNFYRANPNYEFVYQKPRGASYNEPYRGGDFRTYEHTADIFYDFVIPSYIFGAFLNMNLNTLTGTGMENWIDWEYLNLENLHFGVLIVRQGQTTPYTVLFADDPISSGNNIIQTNLSPTHPEGTIFDVCAFVGDPSGDPDEPLYVLEEGFKQVMYTKALSVSLSAEYMGDGAIDYAIEISNLMTLNIQLTGVDLLIRYDDNSTDDEVDPLEPFEDIISLGSITVPASGSYNFFDAIYGLLPEYHTRGGYIYFRCQSHPSLNEKFDIISS